MLGLCKCIYIAPLYKTLCIYIAPYIAPLSKALYNLYSAFIQSAVHLYSAFIQSPVHLYSAFIQSAIHLYSAFIQSAIQFMPHSPIHTPTAIGCHPRYQPARQERLGVRCLAQGHFNTPRVGSNRQPSDCQRTALTS